MTLWLQNVRHSLRALRVRPLHTALVVLTFALGIGLNTSFVATASRLFLTPLPFDPEERLVVPWPGQALPGDLAEQLHAESPSFDGVALTWDVLPAEYYDPARPGTGVVGYRARQVTRNFFDLVGVRPLLGRTFVDGDVPPRERWRVVNKVLLTHEAWLELFGGDPGVVGRTVDAGGHTTEIVGVMPPAVTPLARGADGWTVVAFMSQVVGNERWRFEALARLAPGVGLEAAGAELETRLARVRAAREGSVMGEWTPRPSFGPTWSELEDRTLAPLRSDLAGNTAGGMVLLLVAGLATLGIAVVNASALSLNRAVERRAETGVRRALGADRRHLLGLVLTEQTLLAVAGGAVAALVAWGGMEAMKSVLADQLPGGLLGGLEIELVAWALATSLLCGGISTLVAAIPLVGSLDTAVTSSGDGGRTSTGRRRSLGALLAVQVALVSILMVGAGVLLRTAAKLDSVDPGFDADALVVLTPQANGVARRAQDTPRGEALSAYFDEVKNALESLPGVVAVGQGYPPLTLPEFRDGFRYEVTDGRRTPEPGAPDLRTIYGVMGEGFLEALGIEVLRGRIPEAEEVSREADAVVPVVVNELFARELWGDEDPVGRTFYLTLGSRSILFRTSGVVASFRTVAVDAAPEPTFWAHLQPGGLGSIPLLVRVEGEPEAHVQRLVDAFHSVDPRVPLVGAEPLSTAVDDAMSSRHAVLRILTGLSVLGLILALMGIYGVTSLNARRRSREIGIRRALGAHSWSVLTVVGGAVAGWVLGGLAAGLVAASRVVPYLESMLFGVDVADPVTFTLVPLTLLATASVAALVPAVQALRLDPSETLWTE